MTHARLSLAEQDAPNYREGSVSARCAECVYHDPYRGSGDEREAGCSLYSFSESSGYKPWHVCDGFESHAMRDARLQAQRLRFGAMAVPFADGDGDGWIDLTIEGRHASAKGSRTVTLAGADIESMARGFTRSMEAGQFPKGLPLNVRQHEGIRERVEALLGEGADPEVAMATLEHGAIGWVPEVRVETRDGLKVLRGRVEWSDLGERVKGLFQGVSIEGIPPEAARLKAGGAALGDWGLFGATLTNTPMAGGMLPLAASEDADASADTTKEIPMRDVATFLGLSEDAAEATILAEVRKLREGADALNAQNEMLQASVATLTEDRDGLKVKLDALAEETWTRRLDDACTAGRISAGEREEYRKAYEALGEEHCHKVYAEGRIAVSRISQDAQTGDRGAEKREIDVFAQVAALTESLQEAEGLSEVQAYARAFRTVCNTPDKVAAYNRAEN